MDAVYAYQGAVTAFLFDGRTRALVALLTGVGSIFGSILIGLVTDQLPFGRRARALSGLLVVLLMNILIWGAGVGFQVKFTRNSEAVLGADIAWDWTVGAATGPIILLMSCR